MVGYATFSYCDNSGGGESAPGRGGVLFNAATGTVAFEGGVEMEETTLSVSGGASLTLSYEILNSWHV